MSRLTRASLATVATILLTATGLSAQLVLGVHAGATFAKVSDVNQASSRTGLDVGASLTAHLPGIMGIQVGAYFEQKGADVNSGGIAASYKVNYVEIPVLLQIGIPSPGPLSAHFLVGPAFGYQANCNVSAAGISSSCSSLGLDMKKMDIGAMGGVGATLKAGGLNILLDALYNFGLTDIENGGTAKNRAFTIRAGLGFPLG